MKIKIVRLLEVYRLIIPLLFFLAFTVLPAFASWKVDVVEDAKSFTTTSRSIAVEKNTNYPHIAYGGDDLYHAYFNGSKWRHETIDRSHGRVGQYASIALDSRNKVHISYYDETNHKLWYATNVTGSWITHIVDDGYWVGEYSSIAVDSNDKVHIGYFDYHNYSLKYATNESGTWVTYFVDTPFNHPTPSGEPSDVGWEASIAVDSNNKVHISYQVGWPFYDLGYATNASGQWKAYTIDSKGYAGNHTSIAVDSHNKVHITHEDVENEDIRYVTNANGQWKVFTIDSKGSAGEVNSIAIDSNDKAHICYGQITFSQGVRYDYIRYATNADGQWKLYTLGSGSGAGITVDSNNKVHIQGWDTHSSLIYLSNITGTWESYMVDKLIGGATQPSLAIDSTDKLHIIYEQQKNGSATLRYANNISGLWAKRTVFDAGRSMMNPLFNSMAIDSAGKIHVSFFEDWPAYDLKYSTNQNGPWKTYTLESELKIGPSTSLKVDSSNKVHISFVDEGNNRLKYITNRNGSWEEFTVDSTSSVGDNSIAIDSNGKVHISYADFATGVLKYATNANGQWKIHSVDRGWSWSNSFIAVDSNNKAHILYSYYSSPKSNLKYATNANGTWEIHTIDGEGNASLGGIVLDSNDKVRVTYTKDDKLQYATNTDGEWKSYTIDSGASGSIAIDSNNKVYIAYTGVGGDLKYASNVSPGISALPASKDFGGIKIGKASVLQTFTISNTGVADLKIGMITFTGASASEYRRLSDTCSYQTMSPSTNCTVNVRFLPSSTGIKKAKLAIPTNVSNALIFNISLVGEGVIP